MNLILSVIKLIFWTIITFAFLYALLTHFILWLELRLSAFANEQPLKLSGITFLKSFVLEFFCVLLNFLCFPLRFWALKTTKSLSEGAPPILFVHGYLHHQTAWFWLVHQLKKKSGIGTPFFISLSPVFASIEELAELLKEKVAEIQAETGSKTVILVGHSMGGLVCSYFAEYLAKSGEVAKIITLGTPFKGTWTAALGIGKGVKQMSPSSAFLKSLTERIQKSSIPYFTLLSRVDNLVVPWSSGLVFDENTTNTFILEDHGHLRLLLSRQVIEQIYQWIKL